MEPADQGDVRLVRRNLHVLLVRLGLHVDHGGTRRLFIITRVDFVGEEKRGGGITTERFRGAKSKVTKERQAAGRFVVGKKIRAGRGIGDRSQQQESVFRHISIVLFILGSVCKIYMKRWM